MKIWMLIIWAFNLIVWVGVLRLTTVDKLRPMIWAVIILNAVTLVLGVLSYLKISNH